MKVCEYCCTEMIRHVCDQCYGVGYLWARDETGDVPMDCPTCGGEGEEHHCTNTACPGIRWYALSRADSQMLRMVERVMREEKL